MTIRLEGGHEHLRSPEPEDIGDRHRVHQLGIPDVPPRIDDTSLIGEVGGRQLDLDRPAWGRGSVRTERVDEAVEGRHQDVELAVTLEVGQDGR